MYRKFWQRLKQFVSSIQVVYFTTIFPYTMMTVMVIRGATLDGAVDGIIYYLKPDLSRLANARVNLLIIYMQ